MLKIVIHTLAVFGTVLTATYTSNRALQLQPPGGDVADSSFRWRLAPDGALVGDVAQNRGKEGALDVKGLFKRVLLDLGRDKVLLETESGCEECINSKIDQRTQSSNNAQPIFPNRFQDTQSRITTNLDETSRIVSTNEAGERRVPFPEYSFNVGEVRTVKLQNGDRIRVTASKPSQLPPRPLPVSPVQSFPSRSGQLPSFSPKISGAPTKQGLIQVGPKMYIRVTANKGGAPPPPSSALHSRFQQSRIESLQPLPPVTRPPLTKGVYDFYATTEQPCNVQENELPLTPDFSTGSVLGSRISELVRTDVETSRTGISHINPSINPSSRTTSRISETSDSLVSKTKELQRTGGTGLPVSPFPVNPASRTTSRISETSDSLTSNTEGLQRTGGTGLPVSPFPSKENADKKDIFESKTIEISPGRYVRVNASRGPDAAAPKLPVSPFPANPESVPSRFSGTPDGFPSEGLQEKSSVENSERTGLPVSPFPRGNSVADAPSRGYIPPYRSLAPPTRPPLTQGVADYYSQNSGSGQSENDSSGASDPNKKLIKVGPGMYIRVTAQKDQQKS